MAGSGKTPVSDERVLPKGLGKLVVSQVSINKVEETLRESRQTELYRTKREGLLNEERQQGQTTKRVEREIVLKKKEKS